MNTEQMINAILIQLQYQSYAVFKRVEQDGIDKDVDWNMVAIFFNTNEIHYYGMLDKIVIQP